MKRRNSLNVPYLNSNLHFKNVDRIRGWLLKQSCRTLNFEQLLFLEIFELLHKFGSNLDFQPSGNLVNMMNSARGRHLIAGKLLIRSGRRRGHPWLRAGAVKAPRGFSLLSGRVIRPVLSPFFAALFLCFLDVATAAPLSPHRRTSACAVTAKRSTVSPTPCVPSQPTVVT